MCSVLWRNKMDRRSRIIWFAVERIADSRRYGRYRWYRCYDDVYCLWHMPISTTLQTEVSVSQSDWHKVGSVGGGPANRRSRNWRSKIHGKTKHRWSTINSEHQVHRRSINRRSNLTWLVMEKPDLRASWVTLVFSSLFIMTWVLDWQICSVFSSWFSSFYDSLTFPLFLSAAFSDCDSLL